MWTTLRGQSEGEGAVQIQRASNKHRTTATCLFETVLRMLAGTYLLGDHREGGLGDIQKVDDDDREDTDDDVEEEGAEGKEKREMDFGYGVVSSLGDFSTKGSLGGELKSRHTVASRKPMMGSQCLRLQQRGYFLQDDGETIRLPRDDGEWQLRGFPRRLCVEWKKAAIVG
jgi:hypothetical protein